MLRDRIAAGTPTGLKARPFVESGSLVPDRIIVEMVAERLAEPDCATGFLFDGFPRTLAQAAALNDSLRTTRQDLDAVVLLDVDDEELVHRLGSRWTCGNADCRAVYNVVTQPPKLAGRCDRCGHALIQREDDRPETIRTRLQKYHQQTAPVVEYYRQNGLLRTVRGTGTVDEIQRSIREALSD